jgi:hypothetical protein
VISTSLRRIGETPLGNAAVNRRQRPAPRQVGFLEAAAVATAGSVSRIRSERDLADNLIDTVSAGALPSDLKPDGLPWVARDFRWVAMPLPRIPLPTPVDGALAHAASRQEGRGKGGKGMGLGAIFSGSKTARSEAPKG